MSTLTTVKLQETHEWQYVSHVVDNCYRANVLEQPARISLHTQSIWSKCMNFWAHDQDTMTSSYRRKLCFDRSRSWRPMIFISVTHTQISLTHLSTPIVLNAHVCDLSANNSMVDWPRKNNETASNLILVVKVTSWNLDICYFHHHDQHFRKLLYCIFVVIIIKAHDEFWFFLSSHFAIFQENMHLKTRHWLNTNKIWQVACFKLI